MNASFVNCISNSNTGDGYDITAASLSLISCFANTNTGDGFLLQTRGNNRVIGCESRGNTGDDFDNQVALNSFVGNRYSAPGSSENIKINFADDNFESLLNINSSPIYEKRIYRMKNNSGGSLVVGDVVIIDSVAAGDNITTTTSQGNDKVFGVIIANVSNGNYGNILTQGKTVALKVDGTTDIAVGDLLGTFTTAKIAMKASAGDMAFAVALEAYTTDDSGGIIDALLISPRLI